MEFGVFALPTYFPESDGPEGEYFRKLIDFLVLAEDLGFDSVWVNEHHFHPYGGMIPSPPVLLGALARATRRVRLGTSVMVLPLHDPLDVAEQMAMIDLISGGRLDFGVGRGFVAHDYEVHNIAVSEGQDRTIECIEVILKAWSGQPFRHEGKHYQFDNVSVWPHPEQTPRPPVWMAATSNPASFELIGQHGFNLLTVAYLKTMEDLTGLIGLWRQGLAAGGHAGPRRVGAHYQVVLAEDRAEAHLLAEKSIRRYVLQNLEAQSLARTPVVRAETAALGRDAATSIDMARLVEEGRVLVGTPDDVVATLERVRDVLQVDEVHCTFTFGGIPFDRAERSMRLFAAEVIPRLREPNLVAAGAEDRQI
ncbi:MAG: Luciferase-like, subgroup [Chloroflexi bacterium]|nr:Luciferase-like, subgroup [Chloroflexota bacterium]